jgi:hydrogenase nickel incorporation protein HypA/HybF
LHELSIATSLLEACRATLVGRGPARLEAVRVAVGELSSVEPDLLGFAWDSLVHGGPHAGARLQVDWRPARQTCPDCGEIRDRAPGFWLSLCPLCQELPLRVEGGREIELLEISFTSLPEPNEHVPGTH